MEVSQTNDEKIAIIGGGPIGCTLALLLAEQNYKVDLYERRELTCEGCKLSNGRTINFTVMARGLEALRLVGCDEEVK